ncbi:hypothetical protein F1D05_09710 [Kribbella qitaiheensis]|uniref:Uncharacterized protein n=1 Tax=Kribbella qitaiheensis TaxID=1544730 RepID=A0A7G6WVU8_9ACTN|nr:hypothetical protein [Kribbella qitaiheensis]QNE18113.1 hypothetical protein F1D05_09710 [Kribbella qitaiheensis]
MPATAQSTRAPRLARITTESCAFTFYDIESLSNVFSIAAYTRLPAARDVLEVFFLVDDSVLAAGIDQRALIGAIRAGNPGLSQTDVWLHDLHTVAGNLRLAHLVGLSDAEQVCDPEQDSSYPDDLRPVCDTDPGFDPAHHPFLAGYNSMNYDTTMLALYLSEVYSDVVDHRTRLAYAQQQHRNAGTAQRAAETEQLLLDVLAQRPVFRPITAATLRVHNDELFDAKNIEYMPGYLGWDTPQGRIRRAMLQSGRHLDVARLNEQQWKVSLKRLLGMLGYQIKESDKLSHDSVITTLEELYELLAYNVADCLGLARLFEHPTYSGAFDLKAGLLAEYSETVFGRTGKVRRDRLTVDSSSAKFVGRILAPYEALNDVEKVSFLYPAAEVAHERGIAQVNVLDECLRYFEHNVVPDRAVNPAQANAYRQFLQVVAYYRSIEGQNFNDSEEYSELYGLPARWLKEIQKSPNNLPYFHADGTPSSCFATFSTGGIHGAEADLAAFDRDCADHQRLEMMLGLARHLYPDAKDYVAEAKRQHNTLPLAEGSAVDKRLVLIGSDPHKVRYRKPKKDDPVQAEQVTRAQAQFPDPAALLTTQRCEHEAFNVAIADSKSPGGVFVIEGKAVLAKSAAKSAEYRTEPAKKRPELFMARDDGSTKLQPKYARTSAGLVTHEDFTSYYPNLLRNMRAFYNPELGEDRYATIFFDKERLGRELKQPGLQQSDKDRLTTLRNGTKLILNAASGAGDASHRNPIRMNNRIISMRIIGQLFSWRIGQAQTLAGARIISTNTDGLYSILDRQTNDLVLAEQAALIGIDIEPEPMFLISKDSNNRLELTAPPEGDNLTESRIITASGGTLACHDGPRPDKSLAHPAIIDFALARYLKAVASRGEAALSETFDIELGRKILAAAIESGDQLRTALLFQNVIAASRGSITYPFAAAPLNPNASGEDPVIVDPRSLQMVNRVFVVRHGVAGSVSLHNAGAWKIPPATQAKRRQGAQRPAPNDIARSILAHHGWAATRWMKSQNSRLVLVPDDRDVAIRKINGIDPTWSLVICNDDLRTLDPSALAAIIAALDLDAYTQMLAETFTKNWMNT